MARKILILKGSPREKGNSSSLADQAALGASQAGATVESILLHRLDIQPCNGCDSCRELGGGCVIEDDMQVVYPSLKAADAIVFAFPIYWFSINAQLKLCIDRMYAFESKHGHALTGKQIGLIFTYGDDDLYTSGGINAIYTFESMARYVKFEIKGMVYGTASAVGDAQKQPELMQKAFHLGQLLGKG